MIPIPIPTVVFVLVVAITALVVTRETARRRAALSRSARVARWGKPHDVGDRCDATTLGRYHRRNGTPSTSLDDGTWRDLGMDAVLAFFDRTYTFAGAACLYDRVRTQVSSSAALQKFDALVDAFRDESVRLKVEPVLERLGRSSDVLSFLLGQVPSAPPYKWLYPLFGLAMVGCLALGVVTPWAIMAAACLALAGIVIRFAQPRHLANTILSFRNLEALFGAADALAALDGENDALSATLRELRASKEAVSSLSRATSWLGMDGVGGGEIAAVLIAYVNWFFFLDLTACVFGLSFIENRHADLQRLFEQVGDLDAALSVASVRAGGARTKKPEIDPDAKQFVLSDVVHPLIAEPVPNSIALEQRGVLVTGANMCGKSTFLRAVAINAVLAQTTNTVFATRYSAPPVLVRTVMSAIDDVQRNRSYYYAELESAKALLDTSPLVGRRLLLVDELFRGTNTNERIAAGKALLEALEGAGNFVFAATHDIELVGLLASSFDPYHFDEKVSAEGWSFSYKVVPGPSTTRNAIALLELVGFPSDLVAEAKRIAETLDEQRPMAVPQRPTLP